MAVNFHQPSVYALWDVMPLPMLTFGIDGQVTFANRAARQHVGRPAEALGGKPVMKSLVGDVTLGVLKLPYMTEIELAGAVKVQGQFMAGPSGLDVALVLLDEAQAIAGTPRMALADIIGLIRAEIVPPMQKLTNALGSLPQSKEVDRIEESAEALKERLRRLGDLTAVFGDGILHNDDRMDIFSLLKSVCAELAPKALTRKVLFKIDEPTQTLPPLYGNQTMVRRAFYECVDNAINNSRKEVKSSQQLEVKVSCMLTGEHVLVNVRNQGALPEDKSMIETRDLFAPTNHEMTSTTGARIGLPLVQRIVGLHGGNMRISAVGDDEVRVLLQLPTGAPQRGQSQLDAEQIQRYASDLAKLMSRRKKESV